MRAVSKQFGLSLWFAFASMLPSIVSADIGGFGDFSGFTVNRADGGASPVTSPGKIQLTNQAVGNRRSIFANTPQNIANFNATFTYQALNANANGDYGVTFVMQNSAAGASAVGSSGNGLGYNGVSNSGAVSLQIGSNSLSGFYSGGVAGGGGSPTSPVTLISGHLIDVSLSYNGTLLQELLSDATTGQAFVTSYPVNLTALIGSSNAFVGFTGSTNAIGGPGADQYLSNFIFSGVPEPATGMLLLIAAAMLALRRRRQALRSSWCGRSESNRYFLLGTDF